MRGAAFADLDWVAFFSFPLLAFAFHLSGKKFSIAFSHILLTQVSTHHLPSYLLLHHPQNKPRYVCVCVCVCVVYVCVHSAIWIAVSFSILKHPIQSYPILCILGLHSLLEFCIWVLEGWELGFKILRGNPGWMCIMKSLCRAGYIEIGSCVFIWTGDESPCKCFVREPNPEFRIFSRVSRDLVGRSVLDISYSGLSSPTR